MVTHWNEFGNDHNIFPFKEPFPISVVDIVVYAPIKFVVPFYCSKLDAQPGNISILIVDATLATVGVFHNSNFISKEATGKIIYGETPTEHIIDTTLRELFWSCIKLFPTPSCSVSINGEAVTQDLNIVSNFSHKVSDAVVVTPYQDPKPICDNYPIRTINKIEADSNGVIRIGSDTPHVTVNKQDTSVIHLGSDLHIEDFDKNRLVGPPGPMGPEGVPGADGRNGIIINTTPGTYYVLGYFNGYSFTTQNIQGQFISNGYIYNGTHKYTIDITRPSNTWLYTTLAHSVSAVCGNLLGSTDGYIFNGTTWIAKSEFGITKVADLNNYITTSTICVNGVERLKVDETNIRVIGGHTYTIAPTWYQIDDGTRVASSWKLKDTNGAIFVGDQIGNYPVPHTINEISGEYMCGDYGSLYWLHDGHLTKYNTPSIRDWHSIWVENPSQIWLVT